MSGGRVSSGPVRGLATLDPFMSPPCGSMTDRYKATTRARSARELQEQGCTLQELRELWGFSALELAQAGLSAVELREAGVPTREIANCGRFNASQCREAGCSVLDLMSGRFAMAALLDAGFGPADFRRAGLSTGAIRGLGFFSEAQILEAGAGDQPVYMRPPTASGADASAPPQQRERPASAHGPRSARRATSARPRSAAPRGNHSLATASAPA